MKRSTEHLQLWRQALSEHGNNTGSFKIPKKDTIEYENVRQIYNALKNPIIEPIQETKSKRSRGKGLKLAGEGENILVDGSGLKLAGKSGGSLNLAGLQRTTPRLRKMAMVTPV